MSQSTSAFIGRGDGIETGFMSVPSLAADREDALNSWVPGIGVMSSPVGVTSANPVGNPQPVGTKLDFDERGSSAKNTKLSSSRRPPRGPPRFADCLITNSNKRYWTDRQLSARAARRRSEWRLTQMPGSEASRRYGDDYFAKFCTKRDTNTYSRGLKHRTHCRIRSAAAKLGYQPGPPLIDLFVIQPFAPTLLSKTNKACPNFREDGQGLAIDAASIRAVASSQGLCHYPPIARADSTVQAGTEGSPGIENSGPVLVPDHEGTIQHWFSIFKRAYNKIIGK
ncbi:hypothetical protein DFP73DRAFT_524805 [Morchella snyderi]|nr:hypothetical protein DFP73DRAFT_524805 [Morchella snyderi]